jgi:hypothetical protein
LRRDLLLAPPTERREIFEQARRFDTMGEVAAYSRRASEQIERHARPPIAAT